MKRGLIIIIVITWSISCFADFVDIATVKVNGVLVRELTRNNSTPYFICLSQFNPNDTMTIAVWTDTGGERNTYLTYQNKISNKKDSIGRLSKIILTEEILKNPHLFSVVFIHKRNGILSTSSWEIFESIDNPRIEKAYSNVNQFIENIKSDSSNLGDFLLDSIECNISVPYFDKYGLRQLGETVFIRQNDVRKLFGLTNMEKEYLDKFNSKDYVRLYYLRATIYMDNENFDWVSQRIANFSDSSILFQFVFENSQFKVKSITIKR